MRIRTVQLTFTSFFILLTSCLFYLQIIKANLYKELSYRNSIRLLSIAAPRGTIYDRRERIVARDELSFGVFIVPQETKDVDIEIKKLSKILDVPESLLKRSYKRNYRAPFAPCELIRDISKEKAIFIEEMKLDLPGILIKEIPKRNYYYKEVLAHVLGYVGEIDKKELESLKSYGYSVKDLIGKDGIEKVVDSFLRGKNGGMQVQINNRGRQVQVLSSKPAVKGKDVFLTIDAGLQAFVWKMMKNRKGTAIFMDSRNGEILSMVSLPSYDPNFSVAAVLKHKHTPLLNRAIMGQYPPGSLFKIVVAMAALESKEVTPVTTFICNGGLDVGNAHFNCWDRDGHGAMDIENAIIKSCNVFFYNTGLLLGVEEICEYAKKFGFGERTGVELLGEMKGFVPSRAWKKIKYKERWYAGDTINLSIGQGYLLVTPLQIVRLFAAVANGGELVRPHLLRRLDKKDTKGHKNIKLKIRKKNIELIKRGMKGVVEDRDGTGFRAWSDVIPISGKTGTAQAGGMSKTHAWFAGFAPSENPEISFVIFLENGGSGGDAPALILRKVVEYWYKNK